MLVCRCSVSIHMICNESETLKGERLTVVLEPHIHWQEIHVGPAGRYTYHAAVHVQNTVSHINEKARMPGVAHVSMQVPQQWRKTICIPATCRTC